MSSEKRALERREFLKYAATAVICGAVAGTGGYFAGLAAAPVKEVVKEVPALTGKIPIGGVYCLTGALSKFAKEMSEAAKIAVKDVNEFFAKSGVPITIELIIEDSELKPEVALEKLKSLHAKGVKVTIGWLASSEVMHCKPYADANKIPIISGASTTPLLSIPDDYVFRLPPDDTKQGAAIARTMYDDGIRYVVSVFRKDPWGEGVEAATKKRFEELGGKQVGRIEYDPKAPEFSAEVGTLNSMLADAVERYGADKVAVHYIGFEECVAFFNEASRYPIMSNVRWYGSDGTCLNKPLIEDPVASEFAAKTKHVGFYYAPTESPRLLYVKEALKELGYEEPISYSYNDYDAVWLVAKSLLIAGKYDGETLKKVLPTVAETTWGSSGWLKLNAAGDRDMADYILYAVVTEEGRNVWKKAGYYSAAADKVTWYIKL